MFFLFLGLPQKKLTQKDKNYIVCGALKPYFSDTQINAYLRNWKRVPYQQWDTKDIELALTLRSINRRSYNFLRKKKLLPLPADTTLKQHFKHFKISEGYLESIDKLLKLKSQGLSPEECLVTLSFDGVHLKPDMAYNHESDQILGPNSEVNVMLLRGLVKNFKIPIW